MASEFLENLLQETLEKQKELTSYNPILPPPVKGTPVTQSGKPYLAQPVKAAWWETSGFNFSKHNELASISRAGDIAFAVDGAAEDGFEPYTIDAIEGTAKNYWSWILDAKSPKEQAMRRQEALEYTEKSNYMETGPTSAQVLGTIAGALFSPSTIAFAVLMPPIAAEALLAKLGIVAARLAAESAAYETIVSLGERGTDVEKLALDTLRDTTFGLALYGGFKGLGKAFKKGDQAAAIWHSRQVVNKTHEGVDVKYKVNEKTGKFEGLLAVPAEGQAVGADVVDAAQRFFDEGMVRDGLAATVIANINKGWLGSPLIQGLTSTSAHVRQFYNRLINESIETGGMKRGVPRNITGNEILRFFENEGRAVVQKLDTLFAEHNGIKPGALSSAKAVVKQHSSGLAATRSEFSYKIAEVVYTGIESMSREINEAASITTKFLDKVYKEFLTTNHLPPDILPPRTAHGYFMRMHNIQAMVENPNGFRKLVVKIMKEQDTKIAEYRAPLVSLEESLLVLRKELEAATEGGRRGVREEIADVKARITAEKESLVRRMQDGEIDSILLEARVNLSSTEIKGLKSLLKPLDEVNLKIKSAQQELPGLTRNEQKAARAKINVLKEEAADISSALNARAKNGSINRRFYTKTKEGHVVFRDPKKEIPSFRALFRDTDAMEESAEATYNTIIGSTPEQVTQNILDQSFSGLGQASPTKVRSFMVPDMELLRNGYLNNDLGKMVTTYARSLGKRIAMKQTLASMGHVDWESFSNALVMENQIKRNLLEAKQKVKARDKALNKLHKELKQNEKLVGKLHDYFMGAHIGNPDLARFSKGIKNITAMTMLGKIPLYQVGEINGIVFKQGLFAPIATLFRKFLPGLRTQAQSKYAKENAAHALVGLEIGITKMSQPAHEFGMEATAFERYLEKGADVSGTWSGIRYITNRQQVLSADMTQSRVMASMFKAAEGRLGKTESKRLIMNGINPKDYKKWIAAYEKAGGTSLHGGHYSNWHLYPPELQTQMRMAIHNDIQGSILQTNIGDKPFWSNQPVANFPFQYMGFAYAASNKFVFPAMLNPDVEKFLGLFLLASYGMMIEPMRAIIRGEDLNEIFEDEKRLDQWMVQGIQDSGVGGHIVELASMLDAMFHIPLLDDYRGGQFARRKWTGVLGGPFGGYMEGAIEGAGMFIDGKINERGLTKLARASIVPQPWWLEALLRAGIKGLGFPETRSDAESIYNRD